MKLPGLLNKYVLNKANANSFLNLSHEFIDPRRIAKLFLTAILSSEPNTVAWLVCN